MSTNCGVAGLFTRGRTLPACWSRRPQQAAPPGPWSCAPGAQLQAVTWRSHTIRAEPRGGGSSVQHQPKNLHGEPGSEGPGDSSTGAQQPGRPVPAWLLVAGLQPAGRFAAWGTNPTSCSRPTERWPSSCCRIGTDQILDAKNRKIGTATAGEMLRRQHRVPVRLLSTDSATRLRDEHPARAGQGWHRVPAGSKQPTQPEPSSAQEGQRNSSLCCSG